MSDLVERINAYLQGGGLFNPELANHDAVRDLLIDCRAALAQTSPYVLSEKEQRIMHKALIRSATSGHELIPPAQTSPNPPDKGTT